MLQAMTCSNLSLVLSTNATCACRISSSFHVCATCDTDLELTHTDSPRNSITLSFVLNPLALDLLNNRGTAYKVALMCASRNYSDPRPLRIEFPNPVEITINSHKIQANLRGLKNKPGTVPPAVITSYVERTPNLPNRAIIAYNSTGPVKIYHAQVFLLRTFSVDELVQRIKNGKKFTKEAVLKKLQTSEDDDIEMASFDLTLKDPLSYMRISVPCRSIFCKHNQCWDAMAFLSINEQTPQWTCPICHVSIQDLNSIGVDEYFQDILDKVGQDVDAISVDPRGGWKLPKDDSTVPKANLENKAADSQSSEATLHVLHLDDTEDEDESRPLSAPMKDSFAVPTPAAIPTEKTTNKRPSPVCIDLTSDSDEEPVPPKRIKHSESMTGASIPVATSSAHAAHPDQALLSGSHTGAPSMNGVIFGEPSQPSHSPYYATNNPTPGSSTTSTYAEVRAPSNGSTTFHSPFPHYGQMQPRSRLTSFSGDFNPYPVTFTASIGQNLGENPQRTEQNPTSALAKHRSQMDCTAVCRTNSNSAAVSSAGPLNDSLPSPARDMRGSQAAETSQAQERSGNETDAQTIGPRLANSTSSIASSERTESSPLNDGGGPSRPNPGNRFHRLNSGDDGASSDEYGASELLEEDFLELSQLTA